MTTDPNIGRGVRPRPAPPCGTYRAAKRHLHAGTPRAELDAACAEALRAYQADAAKRSRDRRRAS